MLEPSSVVWVTRIQGTDDRIGARRRDGARECGGQPALPRAAPCLRDGLRSAERAGVPLERGEPRPGRPRAAVHAAPERRPADQRPADQRDADHPAAGRRTAGAPSADRPTEGPCAVRAEALRTAGDRGPERPADDRRRADAGAARDGARDGARDERNGRPAASTDLRDRAAVPGECARVRRLRGLRSGRTGSAARAAAAPADDPRGRGSPAPRRTTRRSVRRTRTSWVSSWLVAGSRPTSSSRKLRSKVLRRSEVRADFEHFPARRAESRANGDFVVVWLQESARIADDLRARA